MRACPRCNNTSVIEDGYCGVCRECTMSSLASTGYDSLETQILKEANAEYFASKTEGGAKFRITELQAKCVIRAWIKHSMPV